MENKYPTWEEFVASLTEREKPLVNFYRSIFSQFHKGHSVLEIGSGWGLFTRSVLEGGAEKVVTIDKIVDRQAFLENTAGFSDKITKIHGDSKIEVPKLEGEFDFIFVDGDHTYEGCKADLENAWLKLKVGGVMMVDDFFHPHNWDSDYGVYRAVAEFLLGKRLKMIVDDFGYGLIAFRQ